MEKVPTTLSAPIPLIKLERGWPLLGGYIFRWGGGGSHASTFFIRDNRASFNTISGSIRAPLSLARKIGATPSSDNQNM